MRKSGLLLVLLGILGIAFFLATDARLAPQWATQVGWSENRVDAASETVYGTLIGLAGSLAILLTGVWLAVRKSI